MVSRYFGVTPTAKHARQAARCAVLLLALVWRAASAAELAPDPFAPLDAIAANAGPVDLGATALAIAHALEPSLDVAAYARRLDALAAELKPALDRADGVPAKLDRMAEFIYTRWRFADQDALSADVFVSFADVLDKRQWNCLAMAVLYVALGERTGLPFEMIAGRGHALVRCAGTPYCVETTQRGRVHEGVGYLADYLPFPCLEPYEYKAVAARSAVAVLLTQTAGALLAKGRADAAVSCLTRALRFDPQHAEAHAAFGFVYAQRGEAARAVDAFRAAIAADPKLREAYGGLGGVLHAMGDRGGAAEALRKAIALCDKQPEPLFNLGQVLYESGEFAGAIDAFRAYIALVPGDPDGYMRIAYPLEDSGKLDEAVAAYREVLRLAPNRPDALVNAGAVREKQEQWYAARTLYETCVRVAPGNALAHAGMGRVLTAGGRYENAAREFDSSLRLDNANPATWIDFARLDRLRGNSDAAVQKLERALAIDPAGPEAHLELAEIYLERGDTAKATEHARTALGLGAALPESLRSMVTNAPQ